MKIGNGLIPYVSESNIFVPDEFGTVFHCFDDLKTAIFPDFDKNFSNREWLKQRAILAPRNDSVDFVNRCLLREVEGEERIFKSIDTVEDVDQAVGKVIIT